MANTSIILRDAKRLIERTLAMAPSGHALLDLDGRLLTCNDAYAQLLKRPVAELADGEFRTHVDQAQCYVVEAWFKAARAGESPPPREILRLRTGDGNSISVLVEVTSIQDHKGNPAGLLVVAGDVSGNAERAGVHPFEPIPDNTAYWQYDPTTDAIRLNAAAEAILGHAAGTYPCRTLKEHLEIHPSEKPTETETEAIAAFLGKRTENEDFGGLPTLYRTRRADGAQIWLQWDRHPADVSVEDGPVTITGTLRDISGPLAAFLDLWDERAKMERRARLSETAIEASGLGTWRILPGDGSAWFSDAWVRSLCYEPGELTPSLSTYFDLIHPGDRKRVKQEYTDVLSSNDARFTSDFRMRRKDGGYVWISSLGRVVESPSQPGGKALVGTQNDITAKMETRRALKVAAEKARVSAARLERLTENVPGGIFEFRIGPEGEMSFPYATSSMEKLLGLSLKALVADGANIFENVHPDDTQGLHAAITASHQTLGLFKYTYRILHSERGLRWIRITSTPVAMPDGSVIWYGSMFDVTEEVEREQALEAAAEIANVWSSRLERLTENVPGGIFEFMMNAQGAMSYRYVTPGMAALVGTTMAELHADGAASFNNVHPEDADLVQGAIERSRDDLEVVKVTYRINHPKLGLRWLRVNASPEPLPDSTVVWYGSMFDVTDEVEREQALKTTAEIAHTASARLERLTDNVPGGIFEFSIDSTGRISFP
ncbi:MAG: PAS domain-containing protein, partial [Alphaproteobacteria bacterium]|nr:PAS domain-containing protein [Alphaproteobacteria bacterium]